MVRTLAAASPEHAARYDVPAHGTPPTPRRRARLTAPTRWGLLEPTQVLGHEHQLEIDEISSNNFLDIVGMPVYSTRAALQSLLTFGAQQPVPQEAPACLSPLAAECRGRGVWCSATEYEGGAMATSEREVSAPLSPTRNRA
jgi:hypothetical protein